jgi:hypothetical protein
MHEFVFEFLFLPAISEWFFPVTLYLLFCQLCVPCITVDSELEPFSMHIV